MIMSDLIDLRESADNASNGDNAIPLHEQFTPLCERAVRKDGTIGLKLIGPGWGTSGYYGRDVLERDIPKVFPPGSHMYWNHATATEEMERPEGNLDHLAAVTVSAPVWMDDGPNGPGMYAESRPFTGYAERINEIGEHIGVSIRGLGRHKIGTAEGREGRIIEEIASGKSVDFVTKPGAGGAIVSIFESAPGAAPLPAPGSSLDSQNSGGLHETPTIEQFLAEAGRVLSKANETKLKAALEQLTAVLSLLNTADDSDAAGMNESDSEDNAMSEQELKEARDALTAREQELTESRNQLDAVRELLLMREAADFVADLLGKPEVELPDVTKARLQKHLAANPPVKEGKLDSDTFKARVETAVTEAQAEIAAISGRDGRVTGNGAGSPAGGAEQPTLEAARERLDKSLASIGYGGSNGN